MTESFRDLLSPEQRDQIDKLSAELAEQQSANEPEHESSNKNPEQSFVVEELSESEITELMKAARERGHALLVDYAGNFAMEPAKFVLHQAERAKEQGASEETLADYIANELLKIAIVSTTAKTSEDYETQRERIFDAYDEISSQLDELISSESEKTPSAAPHTKDKTEAQEAEKAPEAKNEDADVKALLISRGEKAFAALTKNGYSKRSLNALRKRAANDHDNPYRDELNDGKRLDEIYMVRYDITRRIAAQYYDEKNPLPEEGLDEGARRARSREKKRFSNQAGHLMALTTKQFEAAWKRHRESTQPEPSPSQADAKEDTIWDDAARIRSEGYTSYAVSLNNPSPVEDSPQTISLMQEQTDVEDTESRAEHNPTRREKLMARLGRIASKPTALYLSATEYVYQKQAKRAERWAYLTDEERQERLARGKTAFTLAIGAVAIYGLTSRFGGFDIINASSFPSRTTSHDPFTAKLSNGGVFGSHEYPRLENTPGAVGPQDIEPGKNLKPRTEADYNFAEKLFDSVQDTVDHTLDETHGPGRDVELGGVDRPEVTQTQTSREKLFDGYQSSRRLTAENKAELAEFTKGYTVKSGDSVWKIAEKYLDAQGVKNPTVYETDAVKDQILKSTGLNEKSTIFAGKTLHKQ